MRKFEELNKRIKKIGEMKERCCRKEEKRYVCGNDFVDGLLIVRIARVAIREHVVDVRRVSSRVHHQTRLT